MFKFQIHFYKLKKENSIYIYSSFTNLIINYFSFPKLRIALVNFSYYQHVYRSRSHGLILSTYIVFKKKKFEILVARNNSIPEIYVFVCFFFKDICVF